MSTQRRAAALLNGRHDLELGETQVGVLSPSPSGSIGTEDIRNLDGRAFHRKSLRAAQPLNWADHAAKDFRGHMRIERCGFQAPVPQ